MDLNSFIGVWSLVSLIAKNVKGKEEIFPWGKDLTGQLIYTPTGHMSVVYMQNGRSRFISEDKTGGTDEEIREAFTKFDAYTGTYDPDLKAGTVTHNVLVSKEPNMEGTSLLRNFKLADDTLELITPPILASGQEWVVTLTWKRIS